MFLIRGESHEMRVRKLIDEARKLRAEIERHKEEIAMLRLRIEELRERIGQ